MILEMVRAWSTLPTRGKLLVLATTVMLTELALRRFAPKSGLYRRWTALFEAIGSVWTAVLLAVVYGVAVGPTSLAMRRLKGDPLDRGLDPEPTFWRAPEPNPLGAQAAARHQF